MTGSLPFMVEETP